MHTSLAASHFTCLRNLKLETALEPGNLLAELFESSFQFLAFRILGQRIHARSAYRVLEIFGQLQIQSQIHVRTSLIAPVGKQHINSSEIVMRQHQIAANWRDGFLFYLPDKNGLAAASRILAEGSLMKILGWAVIISSTLAFAGFPDDCANNLTGPFADAARDDAFQSPWCSRTLE
jgi:hypothetical protein